MSEAAIEDAVAVELENLADQFELDGREADDRVRDHMDAENQIGAAIATTTGEIYEAVAERLRERATELRGAR